MFFDARSIVPVKGSVPKARYRTSAVACAHGWGWLDGEVVNFHGEFDHQTENMGDL